MAADNAKLLAMEYLEPLIGDLRDPYQTALVAYALLASGSNKRNEVFNKLDGMKKTGESHYPLFIIILISQSCQEHLRN